MTAVVMVALHKTTPLPSLRGMKCRSNPAKRSHAHHPNEYQLNAPQYWQTLPWMAAALLGLAMTTVGMRGGHTITARLCERSEAIQLNATMPTILSNTSWKLRSTVDAALDGRSATRFAMTAVVIVALRKTTPLPSLRGMKCRSNPANVAMPTILSNTS
jgi:hypothetical protein